MPDDSTPTSPPGPAARILILVPHDPAADPRIGWVTTMAAHLAPTAVLGFSSAETGFPAEATAGVFVERVDPAHYASRLKAWLLKRYRRAQGTSQNETPQRRSAVSRFARALYRLVTWLMPRENADEQAALRRQQGLLRRALAAPLQFVRAVGHLLLALLYYDFVAGTLYRRAQDETPPRLLLCHEYPALAAGVRLKRRWGCPLIYDSHELWPEADLRAAAWEKRFFGWLEGRLIGQADAVVTVSPYIARALETRYSLRGVITTPNARPFDAALTPATARPVLHPVRFLLQGKAIAGRGIEPLLAAWQQLGDTPAVLVIRAPENRYVAQLRAQHRGAIAAGRIEIAPPVLPDALVEAASSADVGIIPYTGPNLNHLYACPNKLSEYMHAGLAILANADLRYVGDVLRAYACGLTYRAGDPATLVAAVRVLLNDPARLEALKANAYRAAQGFFHWDAQAQDYARALADLYNAPPGQAG